MAQAAEIPRIVRASMRPVSLNRAVLSRGQEAGRAGGGAVHIPHESGISAGFGGGAAPRGGGDPAVRGETGFQERTFLGLPIGLTAFGERQKADYDNLQVGVRAYATAVNAGQSPQQAAQAAVKAGGVPFLSALVNHPDSPLASVPALHKMLQGASQSLFGPANPKTGQQVEYDADTGQALGARDVPGMTVETKPDRGTLVQTDRGLMRVDAQGNATPVRLGGDVTAGGVLAPPGPLNRTTGKAPAPNAYSDSDIGAGPQAPPLNPKGKIDRAPAVQDANILKAAPPTVDALNTIQQLAPQVAGLGRDIISIAAGKYLGTNPAGVRMSQAFSTVLANSSNLALRGAKFPTQNWDALAGNPAMAPSALSAYAQQFKQILRGTVQDSADQATQAMGQRLPLPQATQLMRMGVFPNGYQTKEFTQNSSDPEIQANGAWWQARTSPQTQAAMSGAQRTQLLTQATTFGNTPEAIRDKLGDADFNILKNLATGKVQSAGAQAQQTGATATAQNATNPAPPAAPQPQPQPATPGTNQQPTPGAPQSPADAPAQPAATTPAGQGVPPTQQPAPQPSGAASAPGQPVPGMPTSAGSAAPSPPPLPGKQTTLPNGAPPAPSTAPTMQQQTSSVAQTQQAQDAMALLGQAGAAAAGQNPEETAASPAAGGE